MEPILCIRDKTRWRQELGLIRSGASQFASWVPTPAAVATLCSSDTVSWPSQHYVLQISFRGRSERMPRERIAKHLSERAPTPPAAMLTTETTFATLCSSDIVLWPSAHDWNNRPELMSDSKDNLHIMLSRFFKVLKIKLKSISLFLFINLFKLIFAVIK